MSLRLHLLFFSILRILGVWCLEGILCSIGCFFCKILWIAGLFIERLCRFGRIAGFLLCPGRLVLRSLSIVIMSVTLTFFRTRISFSTVDSSLLSAFINETQISSFLLRLLLWFSITAALLPIYLAKGLRTHLLGWKEISRFYLQAIHPL